MTKGKKNPSDLQHQKKAELGVPSSQNFLTFDENYKSYWSKTLNLASRYCKERDIIKIDLLSELMQARRKWSIFTLRGCWPQGLQPERQQNRALMTENGKAVRGKHQDWGQTSRVVLGSVKCAMSTRKPSEMLIKQWGSGNQQSWSPSTVNLAPESLSLCY